MSGDRVSYREAGKALRATMEAVARDRALTIAQRLVCLAIGGQLASYSRLEDDVTAAQVVALTGLSERTVREAVGAVVAAGYYSRDHRQGTQRGATYRFLHLRGVAGDTATPHLRHAAGDSADHLHGAAGDSAALTCAAAPPHLRRGAPTEEDPRS